jgi:hypothetical protein
MTTITVTNGDLTTSSIFSAGESAAVYVESKNYLLYGDVNQVNYNVNSGDDFGYLVGTVATIYDSYVGKRPNSVTFIVADQTEMHDPSLAVNTIFSNAGAGIIAGTTGTGISVSTGTSATSIWAVGQVVSAIIPRWNCVVLGRIKEVAWASTSTSNVIANGQFIYTIESYSSKTSTTLRRYKTYERYVFSSSTTMTTLINTGTAATTLPVKVNPISISPGFVDGDNLIETGVVYSEQFSASGGNGGPYTFSISTGSLFTGWSLSAAGLLAGNSPSGVETATFTIQAQDSAGTVGTKQYVVTTY